LPGTDEFQLLASNLVQDIWAELQLIKKINYTTPTKVSMQTSPELDSVEQPLVTTRYGGTNDRFVSLLAEAVNVTIVGITNQRLADSLEKALVRLAGLQYRGFFSAILPLYSHIGVPAAGDHLRRLQDNDVTASAIARLATLYHDEAIMMSLPIEL
jgi:hypothetical protein